MNDKAVNIKDLSPRHPAHPLRLTHSTVLIQRELITMDPMKARDILFGAYMNLRELIPADIAMQPSQAASVLLLELYFEYAGNWSLMAERIERDWQQHFGGDPVELRETGARCCAEFVVEYERERVRASAS